jgi:hypothetical protein
MILLSLLFLPLTTTIPLGEYPPTRQSPRGAVRLRRWCFLGVKLALLLPSVFWAARLAGALLAPGMQAHGLSAQLVVE